MLITVQAKWRRTLCAVETVRIDGPYGQAQETHIPSPRLQSYTVTDDMLFITARNHSACPVPK
jgi:hypothetical protein